MKSKQNVKNGKGKTSKILGIIERKINKTLGKKIKQSKHQKKIEWKRLKIWKNRINWKEGKKLEKKS